MSAVIELHKLADFIRDRAAANRVVAADHTQPWLASHHIGYANAYTLAADWIADLASTLTSTESETV